MYGNNNNPYVRPYNNMISQQSMYEQIDNEINNLQQMRERMKNNQLQQPIQPTNLTQNFQIAPQNNNGIKVVNSVEDVQKELAITDTPFVNSNYTTLWIKNAKGEIRTFELKEIKPKDEKDLIIEDLKSQIYQLNSQIKEMSTYEQQYNETSNEYESEQLDEPIKNEKPTNVSNVKPSKPKSR